MNSDPADRQSGLVCPYCGRAAGSEVMETRRGDDAIRRRRQCHGCHVRFATVEVLDPREVLTAITTRSENAD